MPNPPQMTDAWAGLLECLQSASGKITERCQGDPVAEAEGHRFLSRIWASMRLFFLEQDPERPTFVPVMTEARKFFADNPDTLYHRAPIRKDLALRISGNVGQCTYLSFCVYAAGENGTRIVSDLSDRDLVTDAAGNFEIEVSATPDPERPNQMALAPGVRSLVVRQYYLDRDAETPATLRIERLNGSRAAAGPSAASFLMLRGALERGIAATLRAGDAWSKVPNTISFSSDAGELADLFPTPDNQYTGGWFHLEENQALVVTVRPPDCRYWNVHLLSRWLESLAPTADGGAVCLNKAHAQLEGDGSARFVIASRDPGMPNWLDTGGRKEGCFAFRWLQSETRPPTPQCEVVEL